MSSPLQPTPTITARDDSIYRDKNDGTQVRYYLAGREHEVHFNRIDPGTVQGWHHHELVSETLYVTSGSIEVRWLHEGIVSRRRLNRGDLVDVGSSVHTVANSFDDPAEFVVFRFVPDGTDKRELIKNDRHPDEPPGAN